MTASPLLQLDLGDVFRPYTKQVEFLTSPARNRYFMAGRGAGKSWTLTLDALLQALVNPDVPGALLGRTERDLKKVLLPLLRVHFRALQEFTGFNWIKRFSADDQAIYLHNGSVIYWQGYERIDKVRGLNLAWINADEVCWSDTDEITVYETATTCIRIPCPRPSFAIASSPNGLRGVTKLFRERQLAGDTRFYVARATSYDNPELPRETIDAWVAAMSQRRVDQEIKALALRPQSAVYGEFREARHVITWAPKFHPEAKWVLGVDWGLNRAVALAAQVMPDGRWIIVAELVANPESRGHFRASVRDWFAKVAGGAAPYLASGDRAVPEENAWLRAHYGPRGTQVVTIQAKHDQAVRNGIAFVGDQLAPVGGPPLLLFADSLPRLYQGDVAGILPSMSAYRYEVDSEGNPTDVPYKDNVHDHAVDALRYMMVAGARFKELHGGKLPLRPGLGPDGGGPASDGRRA